MTHDELIAETGMALCENALGGKRCPCRETGTFACADDYPGQQARAAIRVIAPAVLEEAANKARSAMIAEFAMLPMESDIRKGVKWCGERTQDAIRALKTRYEQ